MTARKIERPVEEDAFGTPPAARGNMMNVAGASDADVDPDDDLLTDVDGRDEYKGNDPIGGPVYPEGVVRVRLGELRQLVSEIIKRSGDKYVLYSKHKKGGKRKKLGSHPTKAAAKRQERAIHAHGG
jgi:hypothetical protein